VKTREDREQELNTLLQTAEGMNKIADLYHQQTKSVVRTGGLGRIGLLACQMIPLIVDAEYPRSPNK